MSETSRVLLVGATGLVGGQVMSMAVGKPAYQLIALTRREAPMPPGARMEMMVADPAAWPEVIAAIEPEAVICALGTTWRSAGRDEAAFRAVDHELVLTVAQAAKRAGARNLVLISSAGADMHAKAFYLRVKAVAEAAVGKAGLRRLDIFRPGLLRGARPGERRILETIGIMASPLTDRLLNGSRRALRSIDAGVVAKAALSATREKAAGRFVHDNDGIRRLARRPDDAS